MLLGGFAVLGCCLLRVALASLTNETISDVDSSIQYSSANIWKSLTCEGDGCPAEGEQRTWHAATYDPSSGEEVTMSLDFIGVAIYVYLTLPSTDTTPPLIACNFTLDGKQVRAQGGNESASYSQAAYSSEWQYDQLVYISPSLEKKKHEFTISALGERASYVGFSYMIVTQNAPDAYATGVSTSVRALVTPSSSSSASNSPSSDASHNHTAVIVGLSLTCFFLLLLTGLLTWYFVRRRRQRLRGDNEKPQPAKNATPAYLNVQPSLPSIQSFNTVSVAHSTSLTSDFSYFDRYLSDVGYTIWSGPNSSTRAVSVRTGPIPARNGRIGGTEPPSSAHTLSSRARSVLSRSATIMTGSSSSKRRGEAGDQGFERLHEQGVAIEQSSVKVG
ncbi:hypothetical protein K523DRAFT_305671 [Schizophyllum commune Tattone D]|nr:hypothetical protein K523DRAFT_305671 [Schizophyllum commune Tattone D]